MQTLSKKLKLEAINQGFSLVGITTPEPPTSYPIYQSWVDAGLHGEMAYLARESAKERRGDPLLILPECQSILVLGIHYSPPQSFQSKENNSSGQIAAYASNLDYHDFLKPRLQAIIKFLETETGGEIPNRWYTDTGPILERELAQRAGLGWIGKNSMLIHPKAGSYFILAEIFLGIELNPDSIVITDHGGSCTRCIEACPTDCILPNRTLDANRCLSYLTIEKKGAIPKELRTATKNWVFGCDICQQVCPWNRFAPIQRDMAFSHRAETTDINLIEELKLDAVAFNKKFKGSPIKRSKRRGYLRNVTVAIGNNRNPEAIPFLSELLETEKEPLVRQHAVWALGQIGSVKAKVVLQKAIDIEEDEDVLGEIREILNKRNSV